MQTAGCMFWWVGWLLVDQISKWLDVNFCRLLLLHNRYSFETEGTMLYISLCLSWRMKSKYWAQALAVGRWRGAFKAKSKELLWPGFQRTWLTLKDLTMDSVAGDAADLREGFFLWSNHPIEDQHAQTPGAYVLWVLEICLHNTVIMVHDGLINFWRIVLRFYLTYP
jgi:hypothetical protein